MAIKVGINGFGRIGRVVLRIMMERPETFDICGINLRKADVDYMVYMIKYDSVFRQFIGTVEREDQNLIVNGHRIRVFSEADAAMIPWESCGAEYVIESTGAYNNTEKASRHFKGGAKKVIITAPAKDEATPTFVMGVNHMLYRSDMRVVSNASCTTNCLAPLAKVVHEEFGIEQSLMSTIHAATSKQKPVDSRGGSDWRTGRSVFNNIIPSSTGAAKAAMRSTSTPAAESVAESDGREIAVSALEPIDPAVRRRLLRRWLLGRGVTSLTDRQLRAVDALVGRWSGQGGVALPGGTPDARLVCSRRHGRLSVGLENE